VTRRILWALRCDPLWLIRDRRRTHNYVIAKTVGRVSVAWFRWDRNKVWQWSKHPHRAARFTTAEHAHTAAESTTMPIGHTYTVLRVKRDN